MSTDSMIFTAIALVVIGVVAFFRKRGSGGSDGSGSWDSGSSDSSSDSGGGGNSGGGDSS